MELKKSLMDAVSIMSGKDLSEKPTKKAKKPSTKATETKDTSSEKPAKKPERKDLATDDAKFAAYDYAHNSDQLSKDVQDALKTGSLSPDLEKLLQVLFDKAAVRELVSAQGGVRAPEPEPEAYTLHYDFVNTGTGAVCTEAAEHLMESGTKLEDLETYNMKLRVVRQRKSDGSELSEGTDADYEEIRKRIADAVTAKAS